MLGINPNIPFLLFAICEHFQFGDGTSSIKSFSVEINNIKLKDSKDIQQIYLKAGQHEGKSSIISAKPLPDIKLEGHILQNGQVIPDNVITFQDIMHVNIQSYAGCSSECEYTVMIRFNIMITEKYDGTQLVLFIEKKTHWYEKVMCILEVITVEWYLINDVPVVFGETIKLECRVGGIRYLQPDTLWIWTIDNDEQIYYQQTTRNTKYENCGSLSRTFNLCIHNFSEVDLGINIKCAYGFRSYEQKINLYNAKYEYHPTKDDRSVNIRTEKMSLNITMIFYKVYPMPICFVQKNDGAEKLSVQSKVKHGLFHRVVLFLTTEDSSVPCSEQLKIKCTAAGYSETINAKRMIDCKSHTDVSSGSYILNVSHYEMFILSFIISKILPAK